jgi:hypothetical protein
MKNLYFLSVLTLLVLLGSVHAAFSQAPEGFTYQAEARDNKGNLLINKSFIVKTTILAGSTTGSKVWEKDYNVTTDNYGLFTIIVGDLGTGTLLYGNFSVINWGRGTYFLNVKIYWAKKWLDAGTTQLLSVPYALYAKSAGSITETDPVFGSSAANHISTTNIGNWNTTFGWGNHATAGYLKSFTETDPIFKASPSFGILSSDINKWNTDYGWNLTGNAGTNPETNFIGTTDGKALVFKINNQKAGYIGLSNNTSFGYQALNVNAGTYNTAYGYNALRENTGGVENTAHGFMALIGNTTGNNNTANGVYALGRNTMGNYNTGYGHQALFANTNGNNNTANGYMAGSFITGGSVENATSSNSVYMGASTKALQNDGINEIVIGYDATGAGNNTATLGNSSITTTVLHGNIRHYGSTSGFIGLQAPATVAIPYTLTLPATAPSSNGQVLSSTTTGEISWTTPFTGYTETDPIFGASPAFSITETDKSRWDNQFWSTNGNNIYYSLGKVGIGTSDPASLNLAPFNVEGGIRYAGGISGTGTPGLLFYDPAGNGNFKYYDNANTEQVLGTGSINYSGTLWKESAGDLSTETDVICKGSLAIGLDAIPGEIFRASTVLLKENNISIRFDDTSLTSGFPANDWEIMVNEPNSGGENCFAIKDITGSNTPFKIMAGAKTNSLLISATGRLGLGTSTPVLNMHIKNGDSPGLRLEQDDSGGWPAQTWDIVMNEKNFFIRDVTSGSRLPFRLMPGAPTNSLTISGSGNVGIGTLSPARKLHVMEVMRLEPTTEPTDPASGDIYFDSTLKKLRCYDGLVWHDLW